MMRNQRFAYITILTSDEYLEGILVTFYSVRRFSSREFVVLINEDITEKVQQKLVNIGLKVIRLNNIQLVDGLLSREMQSDRWYHTLFKLRVFGITEYDKLVYLDSDLLVCGNIEELFLMDDLSAVPDSVFFPQWSRGGMNAGVICISPSKETEQALINLIPVVAKEMKIFGDQDVINAYYSKWEQETEKHLNLKYNACFYQLDNYSEITPFVVHFILKDKPWMWSDFRILRKKIKWFFCGYSKRIRYISEYMKILKEVRKQKWFPL